MGQHLSFGIGPGLHASMVLQASSKILKPQCLEKDPKVYQKVMEKLKNVKDKGYISAGQVSSLTSYFKVPKGETNIQMVYETSASGINEALWLPSFALPSADSLTNLLTLESWTFPPLGFGIQSRYPSMDSIISTWQSTYYNPSPLDQFYQLVETVEDGFDLHPEDDE